jgi:hypothetical protein
MKCTIPLALLLFPFLSHCQGCADLRECTLYTRSEDKHQPYKISITSSTITQTNLVTGDSSVWEIHWVAECGFTMKFLSGNDALTQGQKNYTQHHVIALKIENTTPDYYLYTAYRDRIGHRQYARDTLWIHPH